VDAPDRRAPRSPAEISPRRPAQSSPPGRTTIPPPPPVLARRVSVTRAVEARRPARRDHPPAPTRPPRAATSAAHRPPRPPPASRPPPARNLPAPSRLTPNFLPPQIMRQPRWSFESRPSENLLFLLSRRKGRRPRQRYDRRWPSRTQAAGSRDTAAADSAKRYVEAATLNRDKHRRTYPKIDLIAHA